MSSKYKTSLFLPRKKKTWINFTTHTHTHTQTNPMFYTLIYWTIVLPRWSSGKKICLPMQEMSETRVWSLGWEDPLEKKWQPTSIFLPGKLPGQRSLVGYNPRGHTQSKMTEHKHTDVTTVSNSEKAQYSLAQQKKKETLKYHHMHTRWQCSPMLYTLSGLRFLLLLLQNF